MHGQLGQADVHHVEGDLGVGEVAQRAAAQDVRVVVEHLGGHVGTAADLAEEGGGDRVGGVLLIAAELEDDALVHVGVVGQVGHIQMVGVDGMGIVRRHHEAASQHPQVVLPAAAQALIDAGEGVQQHGGGGALLGGAAHLFVVKHGVDRQGVGVPTGQEALQSGEGALEVIQLGGGEILLIGAPDGARVAAVEEQVVTQDLLGLYPGGLGHQVHQLALRGLVAQQGQHVLLDAVFVAVVDAAVHVNGQIGDHQQIPVQIHQAGLQTALPADHHLTGHRQGPVEPGRAQHAAVLLYIELGVSAVPHHIHVFLQLKGGGVAVGGGDLHALKLPGGDLEGQNGGEVAADEVLSARSQLPTFSLRELRKAVGGELPGDVLHGVVTAGAVLNKG